MGAFLIVDSLFFWIALVGSFGLISFLAIAERTGWATLSLIATIAAFQFFSDIKPVTWAIANPTLTITGMVAYFAIGVIWVYPKWMSFCRQVFDVAKDTRDRFVKRNPSPRKPEEPKEPEEGEDELVAFKWEQDTAKWESDTARWESNKNTEIHRAVYREFGYVSDDGDSDTIVPSVRRNKSRIMNWMVYWVPSIIWTVINDPVRRLYEFLYNKIAGSLQGISDRQFRDF